MTLKGGMRSAALVAALAAGCGGSGGGGAGISALSGTVADQTDCTAAVESIRPRSFVVASFPSSVQVTSCAQARIQQAATMTATRPDGTEVYDSGNMLATIAVQNIRRVANGLDFSFDLRLSDFRLNLDVTDPQAGDVTFSCALAAAADFTGQTAESTLLCRFLDAADAPICSEGLQSAVLIVDGLRGKVKNGLLAFGCQENAP